MPPYSQATYMKDLPSAMAYPVPAKGANGLPVATGVYPLARPYPMGMAYPLAKAKPKKKRSPPSSCVKRAQNACSPPTCKWASGKKKQYCTLSRKKSNAASPRKSPKKKSRPASPKLSPKKLIYYQEVEEI
jgi:hypothetical protein